MTKELYFLAIETSCDDTSVSVLQAKEENGKLKKITALSNIVSSQTQLHAGYGGVYPLLAKREHQKNLPLVFGEAIKIAEGSVEGLSPSAGRTKSFHASDIKFIGVTKGPGLDPCLWTGINFGQELAKKYNLPLVGANHLEAHFLANLLTLGIGEDEFKKNYLPAICLVVSGGHTLLFLAKNIGEYELLGETQDDAAGECFDKSARILNLGYPGGPEISKQAVEFTRRSKTPAESAAEPTEAGKPAGVLLLPRLPRPMMNQKNYNFSFSGLKTAVLYLHQKQTPETQKSPEYLAAMSHEIQQSIVDVLVSKTKRAAETLNAKSIIIGGGVSANKELRARMEAAAKELNIKFLAPAPALSVDNAAMSGVAAYFAQKRGESIADPATLESDPNLGI